MNTQIIFGLLATEKSIQKIAQAICKKNSELSGLDSVKQWNNLTIQKIYTEYATIAVIEALKILNEVRTD